MKKKEFNYITAQDRAHMPSGTNKILNRRNLSNANRHLKELIKPGMRILDVGCGSGSITADIAVFLKGDCEVVGLDINESLIKEASQNHAGQKGLTFVCSALKAMNYHDQFDIVAAARVLQWVPDYKTLLNEMNQSLKKGGTLQVLDYNHKKAVWNPTIPATMQKFYNSFLDWKENAGMDNEIIDHLSPSFEALSLKDIKVIDQVEISKKEDPDFVQSMQIWSDVARYRGPKIVQDGFIAENVRLQAIEDYEAWIKNKAVSQILYLKSISGVKIVL